MSVTRTLAVSVEQAHVAHCSSHLPLRVSRLNFLIRKITPDGYVSTLAGTTIRSPYEVAGAGCPAPCLDGVPGSQDGPLRSAKFYYPYDIAIADNGTVRAVCVRQAVCCDMLALTCVPGPPPPPPSPSLHQVVIVDGDRIRRLNDDNATVSEIQTVQSRNRVYTIAGGFIEGDHDGIGQEATFNKPRVTAKTTLHNAVTVVLT